MNRFRAERPAEVAGARWAEGAAVGETRIPRNMSPEALSAKRFPLHLNHYEDALLQLAADLDQTSKQKMARRALREFCERKLKAAGVPLPK